MCILISTINRKFIDHDKEIKIFWGMIHRHRSELFVNWMYDKWLYFTFLCILYLLLNEMGEKKNLKIYD
jgi:hypothetical protein